MQQASKRIDGHFDDYLATPQKINQTNLDAIELGLLDLKDFKTAGDITSGNNYKLTQTCLTLLIY
jgi:hypothetical protein